MQLSYVQIVTGNIFSTLSHLHFLMFTDTLFTVYRSKYSYEILKENFLLLEVC